MPLLQRPLCLFLLLATLHGTGSFSGTPRPGPEGRRENDFSKTFRLIPRPQQIELLAGNGLAADGLTGIYLKGAAQKPVLAEPLQSLPLAAREGKNVVVLEVSEGDQLPGSPEGYVLEITENGVTVRAKAQAGLFYGCQTLRQLLEDARDQRVVIPACQITDFPDIAYRAVHLDLKHHLDVGNYYYQFIDRLAGVKVNALIIEFEDKLRYRKAPLVGASHAISVEEFAALSRYARERHIEVSPLVQGLGHASFILKHPAYQPLRENPASDWAFSPLDSGTYALQFSLYEDAIAATPGGKYLHVGGDEVGDLGLSELSKKSGMKPLELQMHWLNQVSEFARRQGRIPIFWDDMVFKLSGLYETTYDAAMPEAQVDKIWRENAHRLEENIRLFPKECVYMRWNYDTPAIPGNLKAIDWYKSHGLPVMAATAAQTMWPMLPRNQSNFGPIRDFCRIAAEKKLDGILCTSWDDCSPHLETVWRGYYDFAGLSWHYADLPVDQAHAAFRHRFYAPALGEPAFEFQDGLEDALSFWETALIDKGHRNNYPQAIDLIALPDPAKPGAWRKQYGGRLAQARAEMVRYDSVASRITKARNLVRRNEYALTLLEELNGLQIYPATLLLKLEAYDKLKPSPAKEEARREIRAQLDRFPAIRAAFEQVFSKTRLLQNPAGYQLDSNFHHHLANATNTADWMYVYELAMNRELDKWLEGANKSLPAKAGSSRR
jgi:hypothetical protein